MRFSSLLAFVPLTALTLAGPAPFVRKREVDLPGNLAAILQGVAAAVSQGDPTGVTTALRNVIRAADAPTSPEQAAATLQAILKGTNPAPTTLYAYIANLEALNLIDTIDSLIDFINNAANGQDSPNNVNPSPPDVIYPQKLSCDQPYSVDEATLRAAIYIPPTFTYGRIPPVILFPGTGNYGFETFEGNFIPLLTGSDFADPVWVNVPGRLLNDAQKNAEFAAYAINYISSVTHKNVTMLGWSQGNIDSQWAYKYWPSTTTVVSDHVAISPDYDGTVVANFAALPGEPLPPSLLQQQYLASSNFITTLQSCNGDSGYVPTTTIYSGFFDEIVEPQQGTTASAFLNDVRGVGVTNNEVQTVCAGQPAGTFYTHEGVLYNPLAYYLLRDAMANPGPGNVNRLSLPTVCATYLTPGLDLGDLLVTENAIAIAGLAILTYPNPVLVEPAISAYAQTCPVSTCISTSSTTTTTTMSSTSTTLTTTTGTDFTTSTSSTLTTSTASKTSGQTTITTGSASTTSTGSTSSTDYSTSTSTITTTSDKYTSTSSTNTWADWESWTSSTTTTTTTQHNKPPKPTDTEFWESWSPTTTSDYHHPTQSWASWSSSSTNKQENDHNPSKQTHAPDGQEWPTTWNDIPSSSSTRLHLIVDASSETTWGPAWETASPVSSSSIASYDDDGNENWKTWSASASKNNNNNMATSATAQGTWASWSVQPSVNPSVVVATWKGGAAPVAGGKGGLGTTAMMVMLLGLAVGAAFVGL